MPAKVCPRCGEQYEHLHSTTCPQCFAKLVTVSDADAEAYAAARAAVVETPEFQAVKAADDERFRHQSFRACLGVAAVFLLTAVAAVVLFVHAARTPSRSARPAASTAPAATTKNVALPSLPVAAAAAGDVLPPAISPFRRAALDQSTNIPGTLTPIFHAQYGSSVGTLNVYAVPADRPTSELNAFRLGMTLAAQTNTQAGAPGVQFFATEHWRCAVLGGSPAAQEFQAQYLALFAARSR